MTQTSAMESANHSDQQKILADRLRIMNRHLPVSLPTALLCVTIIFVSVYPVTNRTLIISWYVSAVLIFVLRYCCFKWYERTPNRTDLHINVFIIGSSLSAVILGIAGTLLMPGGYFLRQTVIIVIIAGNTAGALQTLQPSRLASSLYILLSILPLAVWLATREETLYFLVSITMFAYMFFMLTASRRGYELIVSSLKLRYENININNQLEIMNKKLQAEIVKHQQNEKLLAQLAAIVEFSSDAIIGLDEKGIIQSWNKGAEALYGYTEGEVLGKLITIISTEGQTDLIESMMAQVLKNLNFQGVELERRDKFGRPIPVSVTLSPIKNESGTIIGISSVDRDISEKKKVDKLKNEFISTVSHELRTPLTSIKGSLGLLLSKGNNEAFVTTPKLLEIAYNNCERLIRLINDILDIEKIETGKMKFKFEAINMNQLIQRAIDENKSYADKYNVQMKFVPSEGAFVYGDEDRLIQVMTNLISNAIKFTRPQTTVEIAISKIDDFIKVTVKDHGEGIPIDYQPKIFEKFTQADSSSARLKGGTGLGLSICKAILEAHNSDIKFKTEQGKGTTFYFRLSLVPKKDQIEQ